MSRAAALIEVVTERLGLEPGALRPETRLADAQLDSLDMLEVALTIEKHTGVEIPDAAFPTFATVGDVVAFVEAARVPV